MKLRTLSTLGFFSSLACPSFAAYKLVDDYTSDSFWNGFSFFSDSDPTNGAVKYVDRITANTQSLAGNLPNVNNAIYMGVDHVTQSPSGRASVRISSDKAYQHGLFVLDISHMPGGICGT